MSASALLQCIDNLRLLEIGDTFDVACKKVGPPEGEYNQKKYGIRISKHHNLQLTFINDLLESYSYDLDEKDQQACMRVLGDFILTKRVTQTEADFFSIKVDNLELVFATDTEMLCKVIVKKI